MSTALSMPPAQVGSTSPVRITGLSGQEKAAIIVRLLISEGAELPLAGLTGNSQSNLVHQMAKLHHVDQPTVTAVVEEFLTLFDATGLSFPGALEDALSLMESHVSNETSSQIRKQAGLVAHADPWAMIDGLEIEELLPILERESNEIGAVILSKLKVAKAAELLGRIPGEQARRITYTVSLINDISPVVVNTIGQSIADQLEVSVEREFEGDAVERVGEILNFSPATTRDDVLAGLEQTDADFAERVRKAIFTFANIPERVGPLDVPKFTRDVDPEQLITALAGAKGENEVVVEFILSSMSKRMAETLREEMQERGTVKEKDAENAMTAVVIAIRELVDSGDISLIVEEETEEE